MRFTSLFVASAAITAVQAIGGLEALRRQATEETVKRSTTGDMDFLRRQAEEINIKRQTALSGGGGSGGGSSGGGGSGGGTTTTCVVNTAGGNTVNRGACPAIWTSVVATLVPLFQDPVLIGQCNDNARAAIREVFHDCGTWNTAQSCAGGCDGSLINANEAFVRPENNGLQNISTILMDLHQNNFPTISMADLIVVASSVAVATCELGPVITTYVGRNDSFAPAPMNLLPDVNASAVSLTALFADKGFDAEDLAALIGAHTSSKAMAEPNIPFGTPQDSSPGIWDVLFYSQTLDAPPGVVSFASDIALANDSVVGPEFDLFINNQNRWETKFQDAMEALQLLGVPGGSTNLFDCTSVIPGASTVSTGGGGGGSGGPGKKKRSFYSYV